MCEILTEKELYKLQGNYNKNSAQYQEIEENYEQEKNFREAETEKVVSRFTQKKKAALYLSLIEKELKKHEKAERLEICGTSLVFEQSEKSGNRLVFGNFCRVRLCPMCQWRRSAKLQTQMFAITEKLSEDYAFVFLTLTVPNCTAENLRDTLAAMQTAWNRFRQLKQIRRACKGYYRGIEVTHDIDKIISAERYKRMRSYYEQRGIRQGDLNPNYGTYHPHYHIVIAVNKSYFTSRDYLPQKIWRELWEQSYRASGKLQVDIKAVRPRKAGDEAARSAVLEVTKYPVKDSEYLSGDLTEDTRTVDALERELSNLRFVSLGGCFKAAHAELNFSDYDDPAAERGKELDPTKLVAYIWKTGVSAFEPSAPYVQHYLAYEAERRK